MSNSSLVSYTKISPNKTSPRNKTIDTITIHHMAGNLSVENCGATFANASRKASSNYGIGSDGRIALYVDEKDRSWCSSSSANDNRAITIEVANDGGEPDWHVSDKALQALINLCADICRRNGIKQLVWSSTKADRVGHKNGCNMTVHRDFIATKCPGDYLYGKMPEIAKSVNAMLGAANTSSEESNTYRVRYSWSDASSQLGAFTHLENAKACADKNPGSSVFDKYGKLVYSTKKSFTLGQEIKLVEGATYYNGKAIPSWIFKSKLYYRGENQNGIVFSTQKTGAVTGVVKASSVI